jgi:hypothetical protein
MSFLIVNETGDTGLARAVRVGECSGFFNLDAFGLAPIDGRMLLYQVLAERSAGDRIKASEFFSRGAPTPRKGMIPWMRLTSLAGLGQSDTSKRRRIVCRLGNT